MKCGTRVRFTYMTPAFKSLLLVLLVGISAFVVVGYLGLILRNPALLVVAVVGFGLMVAGQSGITIYSLRTRHRGTPDR